MYHNWIEGVIVKVLPNGDAVCWLDAKNLDEAKNAYQTRPWMHWRELPTQPEKIKLTRAEIAEKLGIDIDQLEITD